MVSFMLFSCSKENIPEITSKPTNVELASDTNIATSNLRIESISNTTHVSLVYDANLTTFNACTNEFMLVTGKVQYAFTFLTDKYTYMFNFEGVTVKGLTSGLIYHSATHASGMLSPTSTLIKILIVYTCPGYPQLKSTYMAHYVKDANGDIIVDDIKADLNTCN